MFRCAQSASLLALRKTPTPLSFLSVTADLDLLPTLRALRRRMLVRSFLRSAARSILVFYTLLVALSGLAWWFGAFRPALSGLAYTLLWPIVAGLVSGAFITLLKWPALRHVAATIDALGGTRDRFLTALDFSEKERPSDMEALAIRESAAFAQSHDFRRLLPIRPPEELRWLVVPLLTLAMLWWDGLQAVAAQEDRVAAARAQAAPTVKKLESLADRMRQQNGDDLLTREIAARLKQAALQVNQETGEGRDGQKAALRQLAELEQLVQELRRPGAPTPDELKALAGALAADEKTKDAAKDLQQGNFAEAARKLAEAAKDQPTAERAQKVLQDALDHLARQKEQLSKQLETMRQAGNNGANGANGPDAEHQQLLQQLSDVLNQMKEGGQLSQQPQKGGKSGQAPPGGKPMTDEDLKHLLGALQRMKEDQQNGGGEPQPGQGEGEKDGQGKSSPSAISMQSFSEKEQDGQPGDGDPSIPSGKPGTDKDKGTTASPFGAPSSAPDKGQQQQVTGKLGEGESLSTLVPSAAKGDAKATRRYKELTEAAAADAADAVDQENIPLGARYLIRRYFEAIRAK